MSFRDPYYTPRDVADTLMRLGRDLPNEPKTIADFAAGNGRLLDAAQMSWPRACIIANDVHESTCRSLRQSRPKWVVTNSDFLAARSRDRSKLRTHRGSIELAVLNPPFSQPALARYASSINGELLQTGVAGAFVANAVEYLSEGGTLLSILPDSCLSAERDAALWSVLSRFCDIRIGGKPKRSAFASAFVGTTFVSIRRTRSPAVTVRTEPQGPTGTTINIVRGWQQMHSHVASENENSVPLVHTTALKSGAVDIKNSTRVVAVRTLGGPALLFPRVGAITRDKICILRSKRSVVLSDCVFALSLENVQACEAAKERILNKWEAFTRLYSGTGAPYTTLERLNAFLSRL